jgi:hypothetical protein
MFGTGHGDLDGDGDEDLLASLFDRGQLVWFENTDGAGTFSPKKVIGGGFNGPDAMSVVDVDADGDLDVVLNSNDPIFVWFENDGTGSFGPQQLIDTTITNGRGCFAGDIDGDGDVDVVSSGTNTVKVAWFENLDGQGTFGPPITISDVGVPVQKLTGADVDGDGDTDILVVHFAENMLAWHENLGGGAFGPRQVISDTMDSTGYLHAFDADNDGDIDVLCNSPSDDKVSYFLNLDGQGTFGAENLLNENLDNARGVYAADLDNDGDMDALTTSIGPDGRVSWYENLTLLSSASFTNETVLVYPNPSGDKLYIEGLSGAFQYQVHDLQGKLLLSGRDQAELDIGSLRTGTYLLTLEQANGQQVVRFVKE